MRRWLLGLLMMLGSLPALAQSGPATNPVSGYCDLGGSKAQVSGLGSTNYQQGSIPGCNITVYLHGTQTLATIYADDNNTPLTNPFTAVVATSPNSGFYIFWAATGAAYDVVGSGGTPPVTYPAPQTIKEVFLGGGGGGGGSCPAGSNNDVQINESGVCAVDAGIGTIDPVAHESSENIVNANIQAQVGDTTHSGLVDLGQSNGSSVTGHFQMSLDALSGAGYGIDWPNAAPAAGAALTAIGTTDGSGRFKTQWSSGVAGLISCENWNPVWFCNANFPSTTNDVTPTPYTQGQSQVFRGPPAGAAPLPFVSQTTNPVCNDYTGTATSSTCAVPGALTPGDIVIYSINEGQTSAVPLAPTDTFGTTFHSLTAGCTFQCSGQFWGQVTQGGNDVLTGTWTGGGPQDYVVMLTVVHGASTSGSPFIATSNNAGCSGLNLTFSSVTTTTGSIVLGLVNGVGVSLEGYSTYTPGSGWTLPDQYKFNTPTWSLAVEYEQEASAGTFTPTMTADANCAPITTTVAFKAGTPQQSGFPTFGLIRYADLIDFPPQAGQSGKFITTDGGTPGVLSWGTAGGGLPSGTGVVRVDSSTGSAAELNGDVTSTTGNATTVGKVNGAAVPASEVVVATNSGHQFIAPTLQGNGAKVQLSTGSTTTNDCAKFDANGNTVDAGSPCGAGGSGTYPNFGTDTGSVNAYVVSPSGCSATLPAAGKLVVSFIAANASTSSTPTLQYCGALAKTITTAGTNALLNGCINASRAHYYTWDGTGFQEDACDVGRGSIPVTDISPTSGDAILVQDLPTGATITRIICGVAAVTSAIVDFKPASESAWGTLGSSILSGTITAVPGGATGTITTPALSTHTPLMMVVGTVTGTVGELYCAVEYQRSF
jgi:hypothetical protein